MAPIANRRAAFRARQLDWASTASKLELYGEAQHAGVQNGRGNAANAALDEWRNRASERLRFRVHSVAVEHVEDLRLRLKIPALVDGKGPPNAEIELV